MFELEPLPPDTLASALGKAERYRLLNEGAIAESICDDVLAQDPQHQPALVMKILAVTDQFQEDGIGQLASRALELVGRLSTDYDRAYYEGIVHERRGRVHLRQGGPAAGELAHESLVAALECFRQAMAASAPGQADAILRWNACVRTLRRHPEVHGRDPEPVPAIESE